ncbi:MAG: FMN-binding protein [Planctomycetes bacterium]|nr:FMN-binding protein [Planctomycetota bacterium]
MKTGTIIGFAVAGMLLAAWVTSGQITTSPATSPASVPASAPAASGEQKVMTSAEVDALINKAGNSNPDWWDQVPLNYPQTLDLTWTQVAKGWQPQQNLNDYVWGVIQPNPAKWKEGVRLLHHVLTVVASDQQKVARTADELGRMYSDYLQDYARAAFWYRKSGNQFYRLALARCYIRLGDVQQAKTLLDKASTYDTNVIRLYIEIGEYDQAIRLGEQLGKLNPQPGYLLAGDAARAAGRYPASMDYYQKASQTTGGKRPSKYAEQAQANLETLKIFETYDPAKLKDGTYTGSSKGFRGPVDVEVAISDKKIKSVTVVKQKEDTYYYNKTGPILKAIVDKQGLRGVDAVAGATISSGAIINATAKALSSALP